MKAPAFAYRRPRDTEAANREFSKLLARHQLKLRARMAFGYRRDRRNEADQIAERAGKDDENAR